jgi:multidrug efflux pump subunit AcrA (membrane-fusion protein)
MRSSKLARACALSRPALWLGAAALLCGGLGCWQPEMADARDRPPAAQALRVTRGELLERVLLTGELDTVASENLAVPRVPQWNIALRWLASDGSMVKAGDAVAELDNTNFAADLADKKLAAARSASELAHQVAQDAILEADKAFALETARTELDKARLSAAVERDAYPLREYQEKQVARERAQVAFEKAEDELSAHRKSAALEAQIRGIALEKSQREIEGAEKAVRELVLRAPSDGLVVVSTHPWFQRKIASGDNVWVGLPILRLPDLSTMHVNAWLSDVDDGRVAVGSRATSYLDAYPEQGFPGTITEISPVAREPSRDSWRRSFLVTVALDRVDLERMRPGMSVRVEISAQRTPTALLAPRVSVDSTSTPPRLELEHGSVEVNLLACNQQSCAFELQPPAGGSALVPTVQEGTLLRALGGSGS